MANRVQFKTDDTANAYRLRVRETKPRERARTRTLGFCIVHVKYEHPASSGATYKKNPVPHTAPVRPP